MKNRMTVSRCCCGIEDCTGCCQGGAPSQWDVSVPDTWSEGDCAGCEALGGEVYSLTPQVFFTSTCGGDPVSSGECGYLYEEPGVCVVGGLLARLTIYARMLWDEAVGCTLQITLRLDALSGAASFCQEWAYQAVSPTGWDCGAGVALELTGDEGCYGSFGDLPAPCELCTDPPATITATAA